MTSLSKELVSISLIGDLVRTPPADVLLVEQDTDYVRVCQTLSHRTKSDNQLKVWVRSKSHFSWLRNFTEQIGCAALFEEQTPRLMLAEQWNVELPDWPTDDDVLHYRLLEISVDSKKPARFETRYLVRFLGTPFEPDVVSEANFVPIVNALVSDDTKRLFKEHPLLSRCLRSKCEQWAARSSEAWVKEVCKRLPEGSPQVWQWLSLWSGLHGYPSKLLEYVLTPEQVLFVQKVPPDAVSVLPLEPSAREQILTQTGMLFHEIHEQVTSSHEFQKVLGWTSGRLLQEFQVVVSLLRSGQFAPTKADIQTVRAKFESCPGVSENQFSSLIYCVKPSIPTLLEPGEEWSLAEWVRWTTEEYVPYRTWQVHNGQYDEGVEQTVARFSDWYLSEYTAIHKDPDLSMTHCLRSISSEVSGSELIIILLVDCLPVSFVDLLNNALRNVGLTCHELKYRFAGLPTITEYNKTALLSGEWLDQVGNYEALLKTRAISGWDGKNIVYLSNLKAMSEMPTPQEATIVILNLVDGDELLHSDVESKNTTYEDELHRLFSRVADVVNRLAQEWSGLREHFSVHLVTDHGACRILEEEKRSFDSAVVDKLFTDDKYRFAPVPDENVNQIPQNLWAIGHQFKRPFSSETTTFFLPRGHNTVHHAGRARGFMHGGATPEEVIVPTALFKMVTKAWKAPATRFLNLDLAKESGRARFYVQRVMKLEIELQNPNATDLSIIRATVTSPEADLKSYETVTVPAGSAKRLTMSCYFQKTALGERPLEIEVAYEIARERHTLAIALESEFRSAISGGFSLRDL